MPETRTERIARAIERELDRRRGTIDSTDGLQSVSIIVKLDDKRGVPRTVFLRTEARAEVADSM